MGLVRRDSRPARNEGQERRPYAKNLSGGHSETVSEASPTLFIVLYHFAFKEVT